MLIDHRIRTIVESFVEYALLCASTNGRHRKLLESESQFNMLRGYMIRGEHLDEDLLIDLSRQYATPPRPLCSSPSPSTTCCSRPCHPSYRPYTQAPSRMTDSPLFLRVPYPSASPSDNSALAKLCRKQMAVGFPLG
jgi:hypothetical protein